jgi:hypothetical protein
VRLETIRSAASYSSDLAAAAVPAEFPPADELTAEIAARLADQGLFSDVAEAGAAPSSRGGDLVLSVEVRRPDFGASRVAWGGAAFSTLVWLLAGHASWWIDNRVYPDAELVMELQLDLAREEAADAAGAEHLPFIHPVEFEDLQLSFVERAGWSDWLLNILVPPWLDIGDPARQGSYLADRAIERFASETRREILQRFPTWFFERRRCFVCLESARGRLLVVSYDLLSELAVRVEGGGVQRRDEAALGLRQPLDKAPLLDAFKRRFPSLYLTDRYRYYAVPLADEERGLLRVETRFEGKARPLTWTVYR